MREIKTVGVFLILVGVFFAVLSVYESSKMQISEIPSQTISPLTIARVNQLQAEGKGKEKVPVVIVLKGKPATMEALSIQSIAIANFELLDAEVYSKTSFALNTISARVPAENITKLAEMDYVLAVFPDIEIQLIQSSQTSTILAENNYWALKMLNITNVRYDGSGVTVVVLDSGIQNNHPALAGKVVKEFDIEPGDYSHLHGTFVAGIISMIAPSAKIVDVHVFDEYGSASISEILEGLDYVAQIAKNSDKPIIASFSWGTPPSILGFSKDNPDPISMAVSNLIKEGVIVVAAAGNTDSMRAYGDNIHVPALVPAVICVAAVDKNGNRAYFSSIGPGYDDIQKPDVAAPGVDVYSSTPVSTYSYGSGTSYAAPFISGLVALMLQANPNLDQMSVREILIKSTDGEWNNLVGYGVPDGWKAVKIAEGWSAFESIKTDEVKIYMIVSAVFVTIGLAVYVRFDEYF